jgi:2-methylcitrate dehydratase PrpD
MTTSSSSVSSLDLANGFVDFTVDQLDAADVAQLKKLLLDHVACVLCGAAQPASRKLDGWAAEYAAPGQAVIFGSGRNAGAGAAALVNGTSAHGYELDDTHDGSMSHPGAVVITTALALGAERGASGADIMAAITVGYEAMARTGMAANALEVLNAGFHPTALFGVFGATAAAGRLLGLDGETLAQAWGLALSMAGGASQFAFEPKGTMIKRMHGGLPAQNGILAAQLAATGIAGPLQSLEGEFGFLALYGRDVDPARLVRQDDDPFEFHNISLKPYSCCRKFHSLIDALEQTTDGFTLATDAIDKIIVRGPETAIGPHLMRRPSSVMAAQYSMPYIVGASLAYGPRRYDAYGEAHHEDPKILSLIDRVESQHDASLDPLIPKKMPHGVALKLRDGSTREAAVMDSLGTPVRPMSYGEVRTKAEALVAMTDPDIDLSGVVAAIEGLENLSDIRALTSLAISPNYHKQAASQAAE